MFIDATTNKVALRRRAMFIGDELPCPLTPSGVKCDDVISWTDVLLE